MAKIKIVRNFGWLMIGRIANAVVGVLSTAILARLLTPYDFGLLAGAMIVLAMANALFDGAFGINLLRKSEVSDLELSATMTLAISVGLLFCLLIVAVSPLVERFFSFPGFAVLLAAASVTIPAKGVYAVASAMLQRRGQYKLMVVASLSAQIFGYFFASIPLAKAGLGPWALVSGIVISGLCEAALLAIFAKVNLRMTTDRAHLKAVAEHSMFGLSSLLNWVANTGANMIVGHQLGAVQLGLYSRSWKLLDVFVSAFGAPLQRVFMPTFSEGQKDLGRVKKMFEDSLAVIVPVYGLLSVIATMNAPLVVDILLGKRWVEAVPMVQFLFAALVPRCAFKVSESLSLTLGDANGATRRQGLYGGLMICAALFGLRWGATGVAMATSIAITIFYLCSLWTATVLSKASVMRVLGLHLRAGVLCGLAIAANLLVIHLLQGKSPYVSHVLGASAACLIFGVFALLAPGYWLGEAFASLRIGERLFKLRNVKESQ